MRPEVMKEGTKRENEEEGKGRRKNSESLTVL